MRFVVFSDSHLPHHSRFDVPKGDVLIFCGDMCTTGSIGQALRTCRWIGSLPHTYKIIIAGNHDWPFVHMSPHTIITRGTSYLCDTFMRVCYPEQIVKVYGMPWTPRFGNWAFMLPRNSDEMSRKVEAIPGDIDILVTHGPPHGILDLAPVYLGDTNIQIGRNSEGCQLLRERVKRIKPKLHVFGHIHEQYGYTHIDGTLFVNAALSDANQNIKYKPVVIDYIDGQMNIVEG